jgi:hypothetical protein
MASMANRPPPAAWEAKIAWEWRSFDRVPSSREQKRQGKRAAERTAALTEAEPATSDSECPDETMDELPVRINMRVCFIRFDRAGREPIRFRVNPSKDGRLTFSDPRGRNAGTAGTTGIWGTLPPLPVSRPRSLSPTAFKREAARFIGEARASQIVDEITNHDFFCKYV